MLARNMVTKWGLSDKLGPLTYSEESGEVFLGRQVTQHKQVSDETAHVIDEEVRRVIDTAYHKRARNILETNRDKLRRDGRRAHQVRDHRRERRSRTSWPGKRAEAACRLGRFGRHAAAEASGR